MDEGAVRYETRERVVAPFGSESIYGPAVVSC